MDMNEWTKDNTYELLELREEVKTLRGYKALYNGLIGELRAKNMFPGSNLTGLQDPNGDLIEIGDSRIEVKYSSNHDKKYVRWSWHKIFGRKNGKKYDKLLLIGQFGDGFKYFIFPIKEIPKEMFNLKQTGEQKGTFSIDIRYSEAPNSKYQKYMARYECHK